MPNTTQVSHPTDYRFEVHTSGFGQILNWMFAASKVGSSLKPPPFGSNRMVCWKAKEILLHVHSFLYTNAGISTVERQNKCIVL